MRRGAYAPADAERRRRVKVGDDKRVDGISVHWTSKFPGPGDYYVERVESELVTANVTFFCSDHGGDMSAAGEKIIDADGATLVC